MEAVNKAKADEEARVAAEKQRQKEEEERQRRNEELLKGIATRITEYKTKLETNKACIDPAFAEEVGMVFEQAQMVVDGGEASMAADVQTLLDGYTPLIDEQAAACAGGGAPAPAPADGEPAPAEEPPAE